MFSILTGMVVHNCGQRERRERGVWTGRRNGDRRREESSLAGTGSGVASVSQGGPASACWTPRPQGLLVLWLWDLWGGPLRLPPFQNRESMRHLDFSQQTIVCLSFLLQAGMLGRSPYCYARLKLCGVHSTYSTSGSCWCSSHGAPKQTKGRKPKPRPEAAGRTSPAPFGPKAQLCNHCPNCSAWGPRG